jgi:hypothetical protein
LRSKSAAVAVAGVSPGSLEASSRRAATWSPGRPTDSTPHSRPARKQSAEKRPADDDLVGVGVAPGDLQAHTRLVAPEPRHGGVGVAVAEEPRRHRVRLVGGVLDRFEQHRRLPQRAREAGAVADRRDPGVGGAQLLIDENAAVDRQARGGGQLVVSQDADGDQHDVGRMALAGGVLDRGDATAAAVDRARGRCEP